MSNVEIKETSLSVIIEKEKKMSDVEKKEPPFNLQEKIAQVVNAISQNEENQSSELPNPKIQRVPKHIRERDVELHPYSLLAAASTTHGGGEVDHHNLYDLPKHQNKVATRYYTPKMISIGPIHHHLKLGEEHKLRWTGKYVEDPRQNTQPLYQKIRDNIHGLKELFAEEVINGYGDDDYLAWMLFVDGCSLLYFMEHYNEEKSQENLGIKYDQLIYMSRDLILLENQLPFRVLVLLGKDESWLRSLRRIMEIMEKYVPASMYKHKYYGKQQKAGIPGNPIPSCGFSCGKQEKADIPGTPSPSGNEEHQPIDVPDGEPAADGEPIHLLDFVRKEILLTIGKNKETEKQQQNDGENESRLRRFFLKYVKCQIGQTDANTLSPTYKNIRDLKAAKIGVKKAKKGNGISYNHRWLVLGDLRIPKFRVDDTIAVLVLNVIAYEMCPDFQNGYEVSSFVAFLESIIDDAEDVRVLRKAGIIDNVLGSDEEVAQLFNSFSSDLVVEDRRYLYVKQQIELHYKHTVRTWIAEFLYNHFSSPWTVAAFSAAVIALALTGIQAYFSAFPRNNK